MDPLVTPLLVLVLGNLARELITDVCKDYLKDKLKSVFGRLEKLGERDKVELAYQDAMEQAYGACLEMLLLNIKGFGYSDEELKQYGSSLTAFVKDEKVAGELLNAVSPGFRANFSDYQGRLNVAVREADDGVAITVNTSWRVTRNSANSIGLVDCVSTGVLELDLHRALRQRGL